MKLRIFKTSYILKTLFSILIIIAAFAGNATASENKDLEQKEEQKEFNAGKMIIDHVIDGHEWHILSYKDFHLTVPLPIILFDEGKFVTFSSSKFHHGHEAYMGYRLMNEGKYKGKIVKTLPDGQIDENAKLPLDFSITKNVVGLFFSFIVITVLFIYIGSRYKKSGISAPKGIQSLVEPIIYFVRDEIAVPAIGEKKYKKYMPYILTLFFFILITNLLGLIPIFPGGANVTGSMSVTLVLALFTFLITTFSGNKNYWKHIVNTPGVPVWLKLPLPLMPIIEIVGVVTKPFVLMIRLFANITAGHIIVLGFISLIFLFGSMSPFLGLAVSPVSLIFSIFISLLELLVAFIQAYVFALLSAIYFGMAIEEHHEEITTK